MDWVVEDFNYLGLIVSVVVAVGGSLFLRQLAKSSVSKDPILRQPAQAL